MSVVVALFWVLAKPLIRPQFPELTGRQVMSFRSRSGVWYDSAGEALCVQAGASDGRSRPWIYQVPKQIGEDFVVGSSNFRPILSRITPTSQNTVLRDEGPIQEVLRGNDRYLVPQRAARASRFQIRLSDWGSNWCVTPDGSKVTLFEGKSSSDTLAAYEYNLVGPKAGEVTRKFKVQKPKGALVVSCCYCLDNFYVLSFLFSWEGDVDSDETRRPYAAVASDPATETYSVLARWEANLESGKVAFHPRRKLLAIAAARDSVWVYTVKRR